MVWLRPDAVKPICMLLSYAVLQNQTTPSVGMPSKADGRFGPASDPGNLYVRRQSENDRDKQLCEAYFAYPR